MRLAVKLSLKIDHRLRARQLVIQTRFIFNQSISHKLFESVVSCWADFFCDWIEWFEWRSSIHQLCNFSKFSSTIFHLSFSSTHWKTNANTFHRNVGVFVKENHPTKHHGKLIKYWAYFVKNNCFVRRSSSKRISIRIKKDCNEVTITRKAFHGNLPSRCVNKEIT